MTMTIAYDINEQTKRKFLQRMENRALLQRLIHCSRIVGGAEAMCKEDAVREYLNDIDDLEREVLSRMNRS